jgi:hypothetical protein
VSSESRIAVRALGAILLAGLAFFCGYGFLASYELGFPNVWHVSYGTAGVVALVGAAWLAIAAAQAEQGGGAYWRPFRLAALFSLFSVFALMTGDLANLGFLLFLLFLLPIPAKPRTSP